MAAKGNVVPFVKPKDAKQARASSKITPDGEIVDEGTVGSLSYEVFKRGCVHVFDDKNRRFKKDAALFEDELDKLDLISMRDGEEIEIRGSGDNDNLVFVCREEQNVLAVDLELRKRGLDVVEKFKSIVRKAKERAGGK